MHTIQYIATQAESVDHAFRSVKHDLEAKLGNDPESHGNAWFDWFVLGGGRWATGDENQYNDEWQGDVVHQTSPKFQEYLDKAKAYRETSFKEYAELSAKTDVAKIISNVTLSDGDDFKSAMELYAIKKIYDMAIGDWTYESYYYDIMSDSPNMIHLKNSIENGATDWFLVPCDFHF